MWNAGQPEFKMELIAKRRSINTEPTRSALPGI
jgi:hypothetical protein